MYFNDSDASESSSSCLIVTMAFVTLLSAMGGVEVTEAYRIGSTVSHKLRRMATHSG
jgi:hypothetical protein